MSTSVPWKASLVEDAAAMAARYRATQEAFDPATIACLERRVRAGDRCLEVAGGEGSIARWLGERVGTEGRVVMTELLGGDGTSIGPVTIVRHDILDDRLPRDTYDLVHCRLLLMHLHRRQDALASMYGAVKPGGAVVVEELDASWVRFDPVAADEDCQLFGKVMDAFHRLLALGGVDFGYGRRVVHDLRELGCDRVDVTATMADWCGGSAGCALLRTNVSQFESVLVRSGRLSVDECRRFYELTVDPSFTVNSYLLVSVVGSKAPGSSRRRA